MERISTAPLPDVSSHGRIERRKTKWYLVDARPDVCLVLRRLFPGLPNTEEAIALPAAMPGFWAEMNWFMLRYPLAVSTTDRGRLEKLIAADLDADQAAHEFHQGLVSLPPVDLPLKRPLRGYQQRAVEAIRLRKRILLADDVGLGKTAVAVAAILAQPVRPALYVTMAQLARQTAREFAKCTHTVLVDRRGRPRPPDPSQPATDAPEEACLTLHLIESLRPYSLPAADVYVIKYSCLRGWFDAFGQVRFPFVVFDECQALRHRGTARYKTAGRLARKATHCLGLTATPIYNYGDEVHNILNLIHPGCLGRASEFARAWGRPTRQGRLLISDPAALGAMLRERLLMLRRTKHEVGLELPPVQVVVEYVDHDVKLFNQSMGEILELAQRSLFGITAQDRMNATGRLDVQLRHATGLAKAHYVAARARIVLESGEPVILVGWHRDVYDIWRKALADHHPLLVTGSESAAAKDAHLRAFTGGETNLLLLSLRSGEGLDGLQGRCSIILFGELDWSPQIHQQLVGRLHRFGQGESVLALFLVSREGTDPAMADLLDLKDEQSFKLLNPAQPYAPPLEAAAGRERLQSIAREMLERYEVDLEAARARFEIPEPNSYWELLAGLDAFAWDRDSDERRLQARLHGFLLGWGLDIRREVVVHGGVIDMLTGDGVGLEVKAAPVSRAALVRQIKEYAQDERIAAIIAATPEPLDLPERLYGKRVLHVALGAATMARSIE